MAVSSAIRRTTCQIYTASNISVLPFRRRDRPEVVGNAGGLPGDTGSGRSRSSRSSTRRAGLAHRREETTHGSVAESLVLTDRSSCSRGCGASSAFSDRHIGRSGFWSHRRPAVRCSSAPMVRGPSSATKVNGSCPRRRCCCRRPRRIAGEGHYRGPARSSCRGTAGAGCGRRHRDVDDVVVVGVPLEPVREVVYALVIAPVLNEHPHRRQGRSRPGPAVDGVKFLLRISCSAPMRVTNRIAAFASWVEASTSSTRSRLPDVGGRAAGVVLVSPNAPIPANRVRVLRPGRREPVLGPRCSSWGVDAGPTARRPQPPASRSMVRRRTDR